MKTDEPYEIELSPEHKDFALGYEMGADSLELMAKHVQARAADHEPLILIGMLTMLMECAYRACITEQDANTLIDVAHDLALNQVGLNPNDDTVFH